MSILPVANKGCQNYSMVGRLNLVVGVRVGGLYCGAYPKVSSTFVRKTPQSTSRRLEIYLFPRFIVIIYQLWHDATPGECTPENYM